MALISFQNFSFRYHNLKEHTLKNVNLNIEAGEKVLIAGPSGSGKSTLAHCINGLIPFTYKGEISGTLEVNGIRPYEQSIYQISEHVGTILQDQDGQFVGLSVGEDIAFAYENNQVPQSQMYQGVNWALREVGMLEFIQETPYNLSGGQKQKVAIAGILATDAPILLFDEPLANLDPASGTRAMESITGIHQKSHKTIIIVEHRIEDVLAHDFDRIIVMNKGQIVADGHPDHILATNILAKYGLREPLYIEMLKLAKVKIEAEDKLTNLVNTLKYKEQVVKAYQAESNFHPAVAGNPLLSLRNISYRYYEDMPYTLKNVSFNVNAGEALAILGNNGAGKSTLLKVISGIAKQQEGTISYKSQLLDQWSVRQRAQVIGYVMQNPNHMITKNMIYDEVAFGLRNFGCDEAQVKERVEQALRICGLYQFRSWPVGSLSYGQKKRVTIASILAMQAEIIILDEPTAGQDYRNYREFMGFLDLVKAQGVSIILITHDMQLALEYADRALVLSNGEIIAEDEVCKVLAQTDILQRADLKETSISQMGKLYGLPDVANFMAYFNCQLKGGENRE